MACWVFYCEKKRIQAFSYRKYENVYLLSRLPSIKCKNCLSCNSAGASSDTFTAPLLLSSQSHIASNFYSNQWEKVVCSVSSGRFFSMKFYNFFQFFRFHWLQSYVLLLIHKFLQWKSQKNRERNKKVINPMMKTKKRWSRTCNVIIKPRNLNSLCLLFRPG